jgi:hypothetical protein
VQNFNIGNFFQFIKKKISDKKFCTWDIICDYYFRQKLDRQIQNYKKNGESALNTIQTFAKENLEYTGSRITLYRILKSMGFKYKYEDKRKIPTEQPYVIATRIFYLQISLYSNIKFIYLDET